MNLLKKMSAVLTVCAWLTAPAFAATWESSTTHCTKSNMFEEDSNPDLWEIALRKCLREEDDARRKIEEMSKNGADQAFATQCSRNVSYVRLLHCMSSKSEKMEERDRITTYFMGLEAKNEKLPQVSVDGTCRRRAADEGEAEYRACMANQQAAYDILKPLWPHLPRQMAMNCRWILFEYADGSKQMNPDYSFLQSCVEREMKKAMQEASREERMKAFPKEEFKY